MKNYFKNNWKGIPRWFFSNIFILGFLILSLAIFALEDEPTNVILKNLDFKSFKTDFLIMEKTLFQI